MESHTALFEGYVRIFKMYVLECLEYYGIVDSSEANRAIPKLDISICESRKFRYFLNNLSLNFSRFSGLWIHPALTFMLNTVRAINCSLAKDWYKSLRKRIEERRTPILSFLKNTNKKSNFDKNLDTTIIKPKLKPLILYFGNGPETKFNIFRLQ